MEVVGALASSLQIVGQCGQVTMTIVRWVESVRTVDQRVESFVHEVGTLRTTYENLSRSLKDPSMLEAARTTNRDVGGHLWTQMSKTLRDCEMTMTKINVVLRRIQESSNRVLRPVLKQLRESLHSGELVRLREQVIMFNTSLQLPMQMITLTIQLRQAEMTTQHQLQLNDQLSALRKAISGLEFMSRDLVEAPRRTSTFGGSTAVGDSAEDQSWFKNMETYVDTAKKFLDTASVAASTRSAPSTQYHAENEHPLIEQRRGSNFVPLTNQKLKSISMFVQDLPTESALPPKMTNDTDLFANFAANTSVESDAQSLAISQDVLEDSDEDDDTDLQLLQALLSNGHAGYENNMFDQAEDNYREALALSQTNNFEHCIACSTADITLLLGECLVKQEKFDEACSLLVPLAEQFSQKRPPAQSKSGSITSGGSRDLEKGQALSACHLLGTTYLRKGDFQHAEQYSTQAFKGRKRLLGDSHQKTLESVCLVIDMYKAKGQNAKAEAYRVFLKPAQPVHEQPIQSATVATTEQSPSLAIRGRVTPVDDSPKPRRSTFNIPSPFRRHERADSIPTSISATRTTPTKDAASLRASGAPQFVSGSARDTSSMLTGLNQTSTMTHSRQEGSVSGASSSHVHPWPMEDDRRDSSAHARRVNSTTSDGRSPIDSSIPTLYAAMSQTELEQKFNEIATLTRDNKTGKAVERGMTMFERYDPKSAILIHRRDELEKNIKKSKHQGLSGSGQGFAPIHLFCSLPFEPVAEVDLLLRSGADPNALAYKAGYGSQKFNPATPLTMAIDRGHTNLVHLLLEHRATWHAESTHPEPNPLLSAVSRGRVQITEDLLNHGMTLTESLFPKIWHGNSLLHEAAFRCDLAMVELLMAYPQSSQGYSFIGRPGQQDGFGVTPLMYAVDMSEHRKRDHKQRYRIDCLKILLEPADHRHLQNTERTEDMPPAAANRAAMDLHLQDAKGNTIYWYADEIRGGDSHLRAYLDEQSRKSQLIDF